MAVVDVRDRDEIAAFCRRRPAVHAYSLGDLDDFFWPHTQWYAWVSDGAIEQLVLLYDEPEPLVVHALAEMPSESMIELLHAIDDRLPPRIYAHVTPTCLPAMTRIRQALEPPVLHVKMGLPAGALAAAGDADGELLGPENHAEVEAFYRAAYPGTWFHARMLETRRYVGMRRAGALVSIAGVHVYSPRYGAAALGNVATHPEARGQGFGTAACARLCRLLHDDGISTISLNVRADNLPAIGIYERLGFERVAEYLEVTLG
jgi:RimJ/RimL family protein N-acetyltransferase